MMTQIRENYHSLPHGEALQHERTTIPAEQHEMKKRLLLSLNRVSVALYDLGGRILRFLSWEEVRLDETTRHDQKMYDLEGPVVRRISLWEILFGLYSLSLKTTPMVEMFFLRREKRT